MIQAMLASRSAIATLTPMTAGLAAAARAAGATVPADAGAEHDAPFTTGSARPTYAAYGMAAVHHGHVGRHRATGDEHGPTRSESTGTACASNSRGTREADITADTA
jgi:hypothetical protein